MKIIIIGLPYFVSDLSAKLNRQDSDNTYIGLDTNGRRYDQLKFLWHIWSARIVYSIGGDYKKGGVFKIACILRKKMIMHWVGTDVLKARNAVLKGLIDRKFIKKINHLAVVSWLRDELSDIDIDAKVKYIASHRGESTMKPLPEAFSVLTYIGKSREEFYGIKHIISLAEDFPELKINVAGIDVYKAPLPENIQLLGWVKDMDARYNECTLFVRLPEHDGLGYSVIEALSKGRYVALSNNFPETYYIKEYADLKKVIEDLMAKYRDKTLEQNRKGFEFVQDHFEEKKVVKELISFIKQC